MSIKVAPMFVKLRYVFRDRDRHGNVRFYFWRRPGPKVRLRAEFGSPAFYEHYQDLLAKSQAGELRQTKPARGPSSGTWRWLCENYMRSPDFRRLDPRTQRTRRGILESTYSEPTKPGSDLVFGDMPFRELDRRKVKVLRDRKGRLVEAGNNRLKAIRQVFAWAIDDEIEGIDENPAKDVKYVSSGSKGFHTWTPEEIEQFEARHPVSSKAHLALALLMYTGVRRSDVVLLGRQQVRDGWLKFTAFKGRNRNPVTVEIPVLPELQRIIDASPCGDLTFLVTERGVPFCREGFGNKFRGWCNQAGLPKNCSAHGVRKAGAVRAAENGATPHQLMAIFGWRDASMAEHYTREANRKRLSAKAPELLRRGETGTKCSHRGGQ